jgi:RNA polymerase sigma factor (TIGR02999 family)
VDNVTQVLDRVTRGDPKAAEDLLPLVYEELRRLARMKIAELPPGQTLQGTALVHEAYLRLLGSGKGNWENRRHFFAAAAQAIRHILIDRARSRLRQKRGAAAPHIELSEVEIAAPAKDETLLQLNEALEELAQEFPLHAEVVHLRFFAGFSEGETASILRRSERTVQRQWAYAKAWLFERIGAVPPF